MDRVDCAYRFEMRYFQFHIMPNAWDHFVCATFRLNSISGNISYGHGFPKFATISVKDTGAILFQGRIAPGDAYGLGMGVSLAATPEIALDAGLSFSFANSSRYELLNTAFYPGRATVGYFSFGTSFLLTKRMSLSVGASTGVTKDTSDLAFSVALPYRF